MNRRQFAQTVLGVMIASALPCLHGCSGSPSPSDVDDEQKECEHEWVEAPSGETRCKKCGKYKQRD